MYFSFLKSTIPFVKVFIMNVIIILYDIAIIKLIKYLSFLRD